MKKDGQFKLKCLELERRVYKKVLLGSVHNNQS